MVELEPPNTQANTMLSQFVLRNVMKMALAAAHARKDKQQLKPVEVSEIRESEQQALRYVAGYIPYALTRHLKKFNKNTAAVVFVTVLESWGQKTKGITASSFLHFTHEWVNLVDRGGLIKVHHDVFLFFQRCEQITRNYLNIGFVKSNSDINFKEVIMNALESSSFVCNKWDTITSSLSNKPLLNKQLYKRVLQYYTDLRCHAFTRSYMFVQMQNSVQAARKEKALRRSLNKD